MKLISSNTSPYSRKVLITAGELGLLDEIKLQLATTLPTAPNSEVSAANPLSKIPALVTDKGQMIFDSLVICLYLNDQGKGSLAGQGSEQRADCLTRHAAASGMTEAALLIRYESALRPEALRWADWTDSQFSKIWATLNWLDGCNDPASDRFDLGDIATACFLGYLDFRYADQNWRLKVPTLAEWYLKKAERPSMKTTEPKE